MSDPVTTGGTVFIDHPKLAPINMDILRITSDASKHDKKAPKLGIVDELFSQWSKYYSTKILIAAIAWSLGMAALLLV